IPQPVPLGIAHAILTARDFLGGHPFVLYLGDNVLLGGIERFVRAFDDSTAVASIILKEVEDPRAFGVAEVRDGRLIRMVEKPEHPPTNLAVIGVYAFRPPVFDVIEGQEPSARGELEISDTITRLVERGEAVIASLTREHWIDTGKMEDILAANRVVLESLGAGRRIAGSVTNCRFDGPVFVEDGAALDSCSVVGPVTIARGARLRNCRIGPHVAIGARAALENVAIRNSIVMESAALSDCPGIEDSMVGRFAYVAGAPAGSRLTLGDHSRIEVSP
ncbi:MAG: sugar phosphate nucleotidyltransferase, partial [Dehalococcoidia bacterium]|nr:sugar phosphate nucleotidyltransferase [Dehalococcoidia bacterium]